jgi:hypothetical protein
MTRRSQRGSGLLVAVCVVLVVSVIGVGIVRSTSREVAGATARVRESALAACADAGRQLLMSQFRSVGVAPTELTALDLPLDASGRVGVVGGHVDENPSAVQVAQVTVVPLGAFGSERRNVRDITNIANPALAQLGGRPYRLVVHCVDGDRQLEVEFGVRFGL